MSIGSTVATIAVAVPRAPKTDWLGPGALSRLLDPAPAWVTGLSDDFRAGRYGRSWATIAQEKRQ
jgi:hypothetical protein